MRMGPLPLTHAQDKYPVVHAATCPLAEAVCFLLILCRTALFCFSFPFLGWLLLILIVCCVCSRVSLLLLVLLSLAACFVLLSLAACFVLLSLAVCFVFLFMPKARSHRGRPARGAHSRAAAQSASSRSTESLPAGRSRPTRRGTRSRDTTPSVAPATDTSSSTGAGCSQEELLALIREEFRALQQQVPDFSTPPPISLPQPGYCSSIVCGSCVLM